MSQRKNTDIGCAHGSQGFHASQSGRSRRKNVVDEHAGTRNGFCGRNHAPEIAPTRLIRRQEGVGVRLSGSNENGFDYALRRGGGLHDLRDQKRMIPSSAP